MIILILIMKVMIVMIVMIIIRIIVVVVVIKDAEALNMKSAVEDAEFDSAKIKCSAKI